MNVMNNLSAAYGSKGYARLQTELNSQRGVERESTKSELESVEGKQGH